MPSPTNGYVVIASDTRGSGFRFAQKMAGDAALVSTLRGKTGSVIRMQIDAMPL
jgi:predicted regulator of Ras-like GTPase activity (Roadblock/LC7/MglB family)